MKSRETQAASVVAVAVVVFLAVAVATSAAINLFIAWLLQLALLGVFGISIPLLPLFALVFVVLFFFGSVAQMFFRPLSK